MPAYKGKYIIFRVDRIFKHRRSIVTAIGGTWHPQLPFSNVHLRLDDCEKIETEQEVLAYSI